MHPYTKIDKLDKKNQNAIFFLYKVESIFFWYVKRKKIIPIANYFEINKIILIRKGDKEIDNYNYAFVALGIAS